METLKIEQLKTRKTKEITFECKFCGGTWQLEKMINLTWFFPPVIACRDCTKKM
jgi:hypothetical protein